MVMKTALLMLALGCVGLPTIAQTNTAKTESNMTKSKPAVVCKLTTPELQERKRTVIAELKALVLERQEFENGVRYKFAGSDKNVDLISSFIKTERMCCSFFTFKFTVADEENYGWLELSGPEGTKQFISEEVGF